MPPDESVTGGPGPTSPAADPQQLRAHIAQLEDALQATRSGGIDSVIVGPRGAERIHPIMGADRSFRAILEGMGEGAAAVSERGIILYVNRQLVVDLLRVGRNSVTRDWLQPVVAPVVGLRAEALRRVSTRRRKWMKPEHSTRPAQS